MRKEKQFFCRMGRASHCTDQERFLVKKLRQEGKTYKYIAKTLHRSENFVFKKGGNAWKTPENLSDN